MSFFVETVLAFRLVHWLTLLPLATTAQIRCPASVHDLDIKAVIELEKSGLKTEVATLQRWTVE